MEQSLESRTSEPVKTLKSRDQGAAAVIRDSGGRAKLNSLRLIMIIMLCVDETTLMKQ